MGKKRKTPKPDLGPPDAWLSATAKRLDDKRASAFGDCHPKIPTISNKIVDDELEAEFQSSGRTLHELHPSTFKICDRGLTYVRGRPVMVLSVCFFCISPDPTFKSWKRTVFVFLSIGEPVAPTKQKL
jgi:hypothetical protein